MSKGTNFSVVNDEDCVFKVRKEDLVEGWKDVAHCLVGKVLTEKKVGRDMLKRTIEQVWGMVGRVDFEIVGENIFVFHFDKEADRNRVWSKGPWPFDRCLIAMEKPTGMGDIADLEFNMMDIWVQLHNLPLVCMNRKMAKVLAELIGSPVEILVEARECRGRYMRVKVQVDIWRPLKKRLRVLIEDTSKVAEVILEYKKLPEFCFTCGKVGHARNDCMDEVVKQALLGGEELRFGSWLRAFSERNTVKFEGPRRSDYVQDRDYSSEQECGSGVGRRMTSRFEENSRGTCGTPMWNKEEKKQGNLGGTGDRAGMTRDELQEEENECSVDKEKDQWQGIESRGTGKGVETSSVEEWQEQSIFVETQRRAMLAEENRDGLETGKEVMGKGLDVGRSELGVEPDKVMTVSKSGVNGGAAKQQDVSYGYLQ